MARRLEEYETADAILCPSTFVKESFVQQGFSAGRIFIVPYGIALAAAALLIYPQTEWMTALGL